MEHFDAVGDWPIPLFYRELDAVFPEGLFILTIRSRNEWLKSVSRHANFRNLVEEETLFYGVDHFDPDVALRRYEEHNADVRSYFAHRKDFLVMDITGGDGWEKLAPFCGCATPPIPFPHIPARYPRTLAAIGRVTTRVNFRRSR
jgi:Sulfotransferase domain